MKFKKEEKKEVKKVPKKTVEKNPTAPTPENEDSSSAGKDDDISAEHIKGLDEALKNSDAGEPLTLQEFKKMSKKWSSK